MKALSVIIVNYNAKELLGQCLKSLKESLENIDAEIIIIDNASTDGSKNYFDHQIPTDPFYADILFVCLNENLGFSKANNIGIDMADGELILLLNPDTIVNKDAIQKCIGHFHDNPQTGAVGVRMIDGKGKFLKESKRGYPSIQATFYKSMGLSAIFSHSSIFSKYHLGNINEHDIASVDVLSGAFLMLRHEVLEITGGFDEKFFMYGEDIDLSVRIKKAGWQLHYLGNATITHFKGGSTSIGSLEHVRQFYDAMIVFVKKYYSTGSKRILKPILILSIFIRGFISFTAYSLMKGMKSIFTSSE